MSRMRTHDLIRGDHLDRARFARRAVLTGAAAVGITAVTRPLAHAATLDVTSFGARQDNTHSDDTTKAIKAAIAAASADDVVLFPAGTYAVDAPIVVNKGIVLQGDDATINIVADMGNFLTLNANRVRVLDLTFTDPSGFATGAFVIAPPGHRSSSVLRCTFDTPNASIATHFKTHSFGAISDNTFLAARTAVQVTGGCTTIRVSRNTITNWMVRGVEVPGDATGACTDIIINGNQISDLRPGGASRYPIHLTRGTSATLHDQVQVSNNNVHGPGRAWTDPVGGTADQISLQGCTNFEVFRNRSFDGGDGGIIAARGSHHGSVYDNICRFNDTTGIGVVNDAYEVEVYGNECMNNGQARDAANPRPDHSRNGIVARTLAGPVNITGNTCGDNQTTKTQRYGVVHDEFVTYSNNSDGGFPNATSFYHAYPN